MGWNNIKHQPSNIKHLMVNHFVEDEHWCYFDDMYSSEYTMQWIYESILKHDMDAGSLALLEEGHKEILHSECYEDYGCPLYIERLRIHYD